MSYDSVLKSFIRTVFLSKWIRILNHKRIGPHFWLTFLSVGFSPFGGMGLARSSVVFNRLPRPVKTWFHRPEVKGVSAGNRRGYPEKGASRCLPHHCACSDTLIWGKQYCWAIRARQRAKSRRWKLMEDESWKYFNFTWPLGEMSKCPTVGWQKHVGKHWWPVCEMYVTTQPSRDVTVTSYNHTNVV